MTKLHIDIETYSPESIADVGVYKYAAHPDFDILLVAYAWDRQPVQIVDLAQGEKLPDDFIQALFSGGVLKCAHNATFERVCFSSWLWKHLEIRPNFAGYGAFLNPVQWHCTMVQCSRCGLPLSLAQAGAALGLKEQKMTEGKDLIKLFCTPKAVKASTGLFGQDDGRNHPEDFPDKWQTFKDYCVRDVEVERMIDKATDWYPVSDFEQGLYALDQQINDRGVLLDMTLVRNAVRADAIQTARLNEEAMKLTGLSNPNSVSQLKQWLSDTVGIQLDTLSKKDLPDIKAATNDPRVKRVLQIRAEMGKTSNKKYEAMLACVGKDDRVRGLLQFYGSRTGRWAGRLVQVQNLPQNHIRDIDFARTCLLENDIEMIELGYGNVSDILSQLIRTAFIAGPGKTFVVCDFSAIEARVLAWLAEEQWVLDTFRQGGDIYCATASQMFHVPVEKHGQNAELRQKGKIAVLALGYGGAVSALDAMGGQRMGMTEQEEADTVRKWRAANPNIVSFWFRVESAATECVVTKATTHVGPLEFKMHGKTMTIQLPSGRLISYPDIQPSTNRFGSSSLKYHGLDQQTNKWVWIETYGGKLTENIVQATARDCLAEALATIGHGHDVVFHVHDEIICEVPEDKAERTLDWIKDVFSQNASWNEGLPLKGAGYITPYYLKD
jgi:DNA polymerase